MFFSELHESPLLFLIFLFLLVDLACSFLIIIIEGTGSGSSSFLFLSHLCRCLLVEVSESLSLFDLHLLESFSLLRVEPIIKGRVLLTKDVSASRLSFETISWLFTRLSKSIKSRSSSFFLNLRFGLAKEVISSGSFNHLRLRFSKSGKVLDRLFFNRSRLWLSEGSEVLSGLFLNNRLGLIKIGEILNLRFLIHWLIVNNRLRCFNRSFLLNFRFWLTKSSKVLSRLFSSNWFSRRLLESRLALSGDNGFFGSKSLRSFCLVELFLSFGG